MNELIMVCHSLSSNTCAGLVVSLCLNTNPLISLVPPESPQILDIYLVVVWSDNSAGKQLTLIAETSSQ